MAEIVFLKDVDRNSDTVLTVGTFDGVHKGHKVLINRVITMADIKKARSVIVTFDPHPRDIINPGEAGIKLLSSLEERCELLTDLGVDEMIVIPFNRDFSLLTSEQFVRDIIWEKIGVSDFVIGYDHQFGRNREGTIETVQEIGKDLGFRTYVVSKQEVGDKAVSSSAIRKSIHEKGDMQLATSLLGRYYILNGTVVHGDKRGKELGYPTANIHPENSKKVIPRKGVYAVWVRFEDSYFKGMMNIGERPTFEGDSITLEVHILNFDQDLYGKDIQLQFVQRIRDERAFKGLEELKNQLQKDETETREILRNSSPNIAKHSK